MLAVGITAGGCGRKAGGAEGVTITPPASRPTTAPAATQPAAVSLSTYRNQPAGIQIQYPSDWTAQPNKDYTLYLVPGASAPSASLHSGAETSISLDVPSLPPHLPGMVRMGAVEHGFVDDLKRSSPGVKVLESSKLPISHADAKRLRSTWESHGQSMTEEAVLIIHNGQVYILKADYPSIAEPQVRPVFDHILASLQWLK